MTYINHIFGINPTSVTLLVIPLCRHGSRGGGQSEWRYRFHLSSLDRDRAPNRRSRKGISNKWPRRMHIPLAVWLFDKSSLWRDGSRSIVKSGRPACPWWRSEVLRSRLVEAGVPGPSPVVVSANNTCCLAPADVSLVLLSASSAQLYLSSPFTRTFFCNGTRQRGEMSIPNTVTISLSALLNAFTLTTKIPVQNSEYPNYLYT